MPVSKGAIRSVDARTPDEEVIASLIHLFFTAFVRQVPPFERIFGEVKELVGLVAVVVYVLLVALQARQARILVEAAKVQSAIFGQPMEERIPRVPSTLHLVAQHLQYGRQDVRVVRDSLNPLAALKQPGGVDDER